MLKKIYFTYERLEPFTYPEPRTIRNDLATLFAKKYKNKPLSSIPHSTTFNVKKIKDKVVLSYKIINLDWDSEINTRQINDILFTSKLFEWAKNDEPDHGVIEDSFYD
jgi:hypothetical protein